MIILYTFVSENCDDTTLIFADTKQDTSIQQDENWDIVSEGN